MSAIKTFPLTEAENARLMKLYPTNFGLGQSFIKTKPGDCFLPAAYEKYKDRIRNLELRDDDVFILTWPKNGTTWTQELVWCILNDLDFDKAKSLRHAMKVTFLDYAIISDFSANTVSKFRVQDTVSLVEKLPSPRIIKSHLPYYLLPENVLDRCKVVTCLRNPKDAVVSFYHHAKVIKINNFEGSFDEFFDLFMDDLVSFSPYWAYTLDAWRKRDHPNLCLLFFENMKNDLDGCVRKVGKFLQRDLTNDEIAELINHLSFKKMKENNSVHEETIKGILYNESAKTSFFRKGETGDWKNYLTDQMNRRMDEKINQCFGGTGLEFTYE